MSLSGEYEVDMDGAKSEGLARRAAREIGLAIVRGDYPPESALPVEAKICAALGVGRNALREAVKTLVGKGLLKTSRRAGTIVLPRKNWNLLDLDVLEWTLSVPILREGLLAELTALRVMIEPNIAALAAQHATTIETLRLMEAYEAMERSANDQTSAVEADIAFHERLVEAAHNGLVASLSRGFSMLLKANFDITVRWEGAFIRNLEDHRKIADAVHKRDPEAARKAMLHLLAQNEVDLANMMAPKN